MEIKVKDCNNCPFVQTSEIFGESHNWCGVLKNGHLKENELKRNDIVNDGNDYIIHPKWCPLKSESIEVSLEKN
mgnify:FL=1